MFKSFTQVVQPSPKAEKLYITFKDPSLAGDSSGCNWREGTGEEKEENWTVGIPDLFYHLIVYSSSASACAILCAYEEFGQLCLTLINPFIDLDAAVCFGMIRDGILPESGEDNDEDEDEWA